MIKIKANILSHPTLMKGVLAVWLLLTILFIGKKAVEGLQTERTDFNNYYVAAVLASQGDSGAHFYDNDWFTAKAKEIGVNGGAKFAPFPPITAFLYMPLAAFDFNTAKVVWLLFNCCLMLILPFRMKRNFDLNIWQSLLISSLFFVPLASNLSFGQAYLFLGLIILEVVGMTLRNQRENWAAIGLAFCAMLKYLPFLFLSYFMVNGSLKRIFKQKWMLAFFGAILVLFSISFLLFHDAYIAFFETFLNHVQGDLSGQGKHAVAFQSLDSLLNNLFIPQTLPLQQQPFLKLMIKGLVLIAIGWTCFRIFKSDRYKFTPLNSAIFIVGAFVMLPATTSYHFLFLLIPVVFVFKWLVKIDNWGYLYVFILLLLTLLLVQSHHIPELSNAPKLNLIIHYPRLWLLLLLFGYLSYLKLNVKDG